MGLHSFLRLIHQGSNINNSCFQSTLSSSKVLWRSTLFSTVPVLKKKTFQLLSRKLQLISQVVEGLSSEMSSPWLLKPRASGCCLLSGFPPPLSWRRSCLAVARPASLSKISLTATSLGHRGDQGAAVWLHPEDAEREEPLPAGHQPRRPPEALAPA